jgi:hypothetical protein
MMRQKGGMLGVYSEQELLFFIVVFFLVLFFRKIPVPFGFLFGFFVLFFFFIQIIGDEV